MKFGVRAAAVVVLLLVGSLLTAGAAGAAGPGTVRLEVGAPVAGVALVEVHRVDGPASVRTVTVDADGGVVEVELAAGTYRVVPRVLTVDGVRHVGRPDPKQVRVAAGGTAEVGVAYTRSRGVQDLRVTGLAPTAVELDWEAELGDGTIVRRVVGDEPTLTPGRGTDVPTSGTSLLDEGLRPGTTYTYSIFARPGDGAFGLLDGDPVTMTIGTPADEPSEGRASFVLNPRTRILSSDDVAEVATTGDGVRLTLAPDQPTPVPGDHLSVPVSEVLRGGYLGEVVGVSEDGRTVQLRAGALAAAFDVYSLDVPDIDAAAAGPAAAATTAGSAPQVLQNPSRKARADRSRRGGAAAQLAAPMAAAATTPGGRVECNAEGGVEVDPDVDLAHAGHAAVTVSKYEVKWLPDIPNGVGFDLGYSTTLTGTVDVEVENAVECGLPLPNFYRQITTYPVPLAVEARPELGVSMSSSGAVENLGFTATAGFTADGYMGLEGDDYFDGDLINTSTPTEPTGRGTFGFGLEVGGSIAFGPGVGTNDAGVIVGVGGELFIVDATAEVVQVAEGDDVSTCIELAVASRAGIVVTLRAWLPGYEFDQTVPIESLDGSFDWLGSPWHWPDDCTEDDAPTDDVVGDGVTPVDDELVGQSDQWGKVEGFVPGESTWVLSTGRVADAVGDPGYFASTGLGMPGDAALTALSGFTTYDAAAFRVTVIPNGETLKVRYAFASEEYPEYVGSRYNDVMAVLVDGRNCALVPGTQTPVAINSVNQFTNSELYVDNLFGGAGYGTSMDGLTKPLTCSVPVEPGVPVTIRIAVADASDDAYDSAIALLDGGIWSE